MLSGKRDSNSRPQPWQGCALPTELFPQLVCLRHFSKCAAKVLCFFEPANLFLVFFSFKAFFCPNRVFPFLANGLFQPLHGLFYRCSPVSFFPVPYRLSTKGLSNDTIHQHARWKPISLLRMFICVSFSPRVYLCQNEVPRAQRLWGHHKSLCWCHRGILTTLHL